MTSGDSYGSNGRLCDYHIIRTRSEGKLSLAKHCQRLILTCSEAFVLFVPKWLDPLGMPLCSL